MWVLAGHRYGPPRALASPRGDRLMPGSGRCCRSGQEAPGPTVALEGSPKYVCGGAGGTRGWFAAGYVGSGGLDLLEDSCSICFLLFSCILTTLQRWPC